MRRAAIALAAALLVALALAGPARAAFGVYGFSVGFEEADGSAAQAGAHPFAMNTTFGTNFDGELVPEGWLRDFTANLPPGFLADTTAYPACTTAQFLALNGSGTPSCSIDSQVGIIAIAAQSAGAWETYPIFDVAPPPGVLLRFGFHVATQNIFIDASLNQSPPYNGIAASRNTLQLIDVFGSKIQLWGDPSDPAHDELRGACGHQSRTLAPGDLDFQFEPTGESCPAAASPRAFLTMPTQCASPLLSSYQALSWEGAADAGSASLPALFGCGKLELRPSISARPSTRAAQSPSGLDFSLGVEDRGLVSNNEGARAQSAIRKAVVTLPAGMSVNPSQAEGLEVCSEADLGRETLAAQPGEGCPQASKVGTVEVESPLVDRALHGGLFVAEPYHNLAGDSLIAVYMVFKSKDLGIIVKQPLKVEADPRTGRLISTADEIPQLPFSHFRLHFREGGRAPLISPPGCGSFETTAMLYPWSGNPPVESTDTFEIVSGPNESACPSGAAPFNPGFEAGTLNNAAAHYSPLTMRITRRDGEQDLSRFSAVLPPGLLGRVGGVPWCPEAGIARAIARSGEHGGTAELADPSCPAASQIGRTVAGAGVGSQLTYVPGSLYLAGPYHGDPLSVVAITPAVAGPFDAGTVVVREALTLNPITAEVEVDGAASDPIPHILQGIPLNVRDLRVYADRPGFTLNATSCEPELARATLWGAGTVLAPTGETPVGLAARYQASSCASLGFRPKLAIKLRGGAKRGAHPALRAVVTPRAGDANFSAAVVRLPHSAFLDQGHIRTVCTRVQFAAGAGNGAACPPGAQYGYARAFSPLLAEPLQGPVYLRSSSHKLPDLVVALHGLVDIDLAARIDSVKGGIRTSFAAVPDAPVSRFILDMRGARKGLIVNSTDLCQKPKANRARAGLRAQNGKRRTLTPVVRAAGCKKKRRGGRGSHRKKQHGGGRGHPTGAGSQ